MNSMEKRVKVATAMGWTRFIACDFEQALGLPPGAEGSKPITQGHQLPPDPFTDANDDYAVLEWMRGSPDFANYRRLGESYLYRMGDYARAALKVIE